MKIFATLILFLKDNAWFLWMILLKTILLFFTSRLTTNTDIQKHFTQVYRNIHIVKHSCYDMRNFIYRWANYWNNCTNDVKYWKDLNLYFIVIIIIMIFCNFFFLLLAFVIYYLHNLVTFNSFCMVLFSLFALLFC